MARYSIDNATVRALRNQYLGYSDEKNLDCDDPKISIELTEHAYRPGQVIKGHINLSLTDAVSVHSIEIRLFGIVKAVNKRVSLSTNFNAKYTKTFLRKQKTILDIPTNTSIPSSSFPTNPLKNRRWSLAGPSSSTLYTTNLSKSDIQDFCPPITAQPRRASRIPYSGLVNSAIQELSPDNSTYPIPPQMSVDISTDSTVDITADSQDSSTIPADYLSTRRPVHKYAFDQLSIKSFSSDVMADRSINNTSETILQPGFYSIEFSLRIPDYPLPSSFQHNDGSISYHLNSSLNAVSGSLVVPLFTSANESIMMISTLDPATINDVSGSFETKSIKGNIGRLFWKTGFIEAFATLNKRITVAGQTVSLTLNVINQSDAQKFFVQVTLLKKCTFGSSLQGRDEERKGKDLSTIPMQARRFSTSSNDTASISLFSGPASARPSLSLSFHDEDALPPPIFTETMNTHHKTTLLPWRREKQNPPRRPAETTIVEFTKLGKYSRVYDAERQINQTIFIRIPENAGFTIDTSLIKVTFEIKVKITTDKSLWQGPIRLEAMPIWVVGDEIAILGTPEYSNHTLQPSTTHQIDV